MAKIKFDNGVVVEFNGTPSPQDVEEVAKKLGLKPNKIATRNIPTTDKPEFVGGNKSQNNAFKVAQFTGMAKFGQGLAAAGRTLTGGVNKDIAVQQAGDSKVQELITAARRQTDPAKKRRLLEMANKLGANVSVEEIDPNLQLTGKEVLGSAANTALNIASAGSLANTGRVSGAISRVANIGAQGGRVAKTANLAAKGGAYGYASDVAMNATQNKDNIFKPGGGAVVGASLPVATSVFGYGLRKILGTTTGAGSDVLDRALKNPDAVSEAVKKYSDDGSRMALVESAKESISEFLSRRSQKFGEGTSKLTLKAPIRKGDVLNAFENAIESFNGNIDNGSLKFNNTTLTASDRADLEKFWTEFQSWQDFTPKGVDNLRQMIGNHMDDFRATNNSRANVVLGKLKKFVTSELESKGSGYSEILKDYGNETRLAQNLLSELNLKGNAKPSTQINSILKIFKKDPQVMKDLYTIMGKEKADELLNELSGAILSNWLPASGKLNNLVREGGAVAGLGSAFAGIVNAPAAIAGAASVSPRIVGKGARLTGKAIQQGVGTGVRRVLTRAASR